MTVRPRFRSSRHLKTILSANYPLHFQFVMWREYGSKPLALTLQLEFIMRLPVDTNCKRWADIRPGKIVYAFSCDKNYHFPIVSVISTNIRTSSSSHELKNGYDQLEQQDRKQVRPNDGSQNDIQKPGIQ